MRDELFDELVEALREAKAYLRGEQAPARVTFMGEPDPRQVRGELGMTEEQFAGACGVSVEALRRWEQGHRPASPGR